jgi:hypothetical protein
LKGYLPIGFEFAAEITYPVPEGTSTGLLNCIACLFGIILSFGGSAFIKEGSLYFNVMCCTLLGIGMVMNLVVKEDLRRQRAGTDVVMGAGTDAGNGTGAAEQKGDKEITPLLSVLNEESCEE